MPKMGLGLVNKTLTERERAAIALHVFQGVTDWGLLYAIAQPGAYDRDFPKNSVSTWKNSAKIRDLIRDYTAARDARENAIKTAAFEEGQRVLIERAGADDNGAGLVDYSDPKNQLRKLNLLVNSAKDPGEVLDALKVIISGQRDDRQAAREGRQVRAYLPLLCYQCPLYEEKRKNI